MQLVYSGQKVSDCTALGTWSTWGVFNEKNNFEFCCKSVAKELGRKRIISLLNLPTKQTNKKICCKSQGNLPFLSLLVLFIFHIFHCSDLWQRCLYKLYLVVVFSDTMEKNVLVPKLLLHRFKVREVFSLSSEVTREKINSKSKSIFSGGKKKKENIAPLVWMYPASHPDRLYQRPNIVRCIELISICISCFHCRNIKLIYFLLRRGQTAVFASTAPWKYWLWTATWLVWSGSQTQYFGTPRQQKHTGSPPQTSSSGYGMTARSCTP